MEVIDDGLNTQSTLPKHKLTKKMTAPLKTPTQSTLWQMDKEFFQPLSVPSPILPQEEASSMFGMSALPPQDSSFPAYETQANETQVGEEVPSPMSTPQPPWPVHNTPASLVSLDGVCCNVEEW